MMDNSEEVAALLHIHEKASAHGEALKNIRDAAMKKLQQINDSHSPPAKESEAPPKESPAHIGAPPASLKEKFSNG